ncbi:WXG100 family type VII secretion target [Streptomyces sp. NPDC047046]|uniref:WXG100 family type VII secretion target n=1 Tax=Streptomyces sp. NPDC047046 TaxID=3155378 RepID=UPI0033E58669
MPDLAGSNIFVAGRLEEAGPQLNRRAAEIEVELDALRKKLQPLIDTWIAQSSTEYQMHMRDWDTAAIALLGSEAEGGVLGTIAAMMRVNWGNYVDAEEASVKTWHYQ